MTEAVHSFAKTTIIKRLYNGALVYVCIYFYIYIYTVYGIRVLYYYVVVYIRVYIVHTM